MRESISLDWSRGPPSGRGSPLKDVGALAPGSPRSNSKPTGASENRSSGHRAATTNITQVTVTVFQSLVPQLLLFPCPFLFSNKCLPSWSIFDSSSHATGNELPAYLAPAEFPLLIKNAVTNSINRISLPRFII